MSVRFKICLLFSLLLVTLGAGVPLNAALADERLIGYMGNYQGAPLNAALAADADADADGDGTYQVRQGETLFEVMRKTGVPVNDIIRLNQLPAPYHLRAGQALILKGTLPAVEPEAYQPDSSGFYAVRAGETLYEVARKTGVPVGELIDLNQLAAPYHLQAGQVLTLGELKQGIII